MLSATLITWQDSSQGIYLADKPLNSENFGFTFTSACVKACLKRPHQQGDSVTVNTTLLVNITQAYGGEVAVWGVVTHITLIIHLHSVAPSILCTFSVVSVHFAPSPKMNYEHTNCMYCTHGNCIRLFTVCHYKHPYMACASKKRGGGGFLKTWLYGSASGQKLTDLYKQTRQWEV